jgi:hypothetical protein
MEAVEWALATLVGILMLLVLMLGLVAVGAWLLRTICRIWNDRPPSTSSSNREDVPS